MQLFDFVTREEMRSAPADRTEAFLHLFDLASKRLYERTDRLNWDESGEVINEARYAYMNVVVGLARTYGVRSIADIDVPAVHNYGNLDYRQFKADIDQEIVLLMGRHVDEEREDSVALAPPTKERLRSYIHHIKDWIDKADLPDERRAALLAKIAEFEVALEENRLSLAKLMKLIFQFSITGLALADSQTLHRLVDKMVAAVAEVHAIEEEQRKLPPQPDRLALPASRSRREEPIQESFATDLDDEIPF